MKYLKKITNFNESMHRENCDRCGKPTNGITTMSMFNEDVICEKCKMDEKNDPDYKDAEEAERDAIRRGDYNYSYIPNYKPIKRFNEMVDLPKTWDIKEETDTKYDVESIFMEFTDLKVEIHSNKYEDNSRNTEGEFISFRITSKNDLDISNLQSLKKGKYFTATEDFSHRFNQLLKWADEEGYKTSTLFTTLPYEITKKDGKVGKTNPKITPKINKCDKMIGREIRSIDVVCIKKQ